MPEVLSCLTCPTKLAHVVALLHCWSWFLQRTRKGLRRADESGFLINNGPFEIPVFILNTWQVFSNSIFAAQDMINWPFLPLVWFEDEIFQ
jgi:hypothetical protein